MKFLKALFGASKKKEEEALPQDPSHLRLLALLQQEGRLIDFLKEDISSYSDAQIGAAVRLVHSKCQEVLESNVTLRPLYTEEEGSTITIPQGFDPSQVKLTGNVKGEPPYRGTLRHRGWKAHKESLPKSHLENARAVVSPAEVEI